MISELILAATNFLNINIIDNHIIFLDVWSIIHIISGLLLMLLLIKLKKPNPFTVLIILLITWELFEFTNYEILGTTFIGKEKMINIVWDVLVGIGGGGLSWSMLNNK